jgi:hypothetical protein
MGVQLTLRPLQLRHRCPSQVDGPGVRTVTLRMLREGIGAALRDAMSATAVEDFCTGIGLAPPEPPEDIAFTSKRAYVVRRLAGKTQVELVEIALRVLDECDGAGTAATELADLVGRLGGGGVPGELKNLIFAADGVPAENPVHAGHAAC